MATVEAKNPDGSIADVVEVDMEESGLGFVLTDWEGDRIFIHRLAWDGIALAVKLMLEAEKEKGSINGSS
jgi:hypothetical protein